MRKGWLASVLALCLLLSGCSFWMNGHYASVEPYVGQNKKEDDGIVAVSSSQEMREALEDMVSAALESRTISVQNMASEAVEENIQRAIHNVLTNDPIAAYAVEDIAYSIGVTGGVPAVVVTVHYNHNRSEIQRIRQVTGIDGATQLITAALSELETGIVLEVQNYWSADFTQIVEDYALSHPDVVMEIPQVTVNIYPESGSVRVVELMFTYQNSRDDLRSMQWYVQPRFEASSLYVSGEEPESVKFSRLYAFLMETTQYTLETSITPAYSLLRHSVGDSKAFATVYAAMCCQAGLNCQIVTGTKAGEPWFWNIICEEDVYYHVDLLQSSAAGVYKKMSDGEMSGYVWDYAAYPQCGLQEEIPDGTE